MNEDNRQKAFQRTMGSAEDTGEYVLRQDDNELERCLRRKPDKLENNLGNCRVKIKKSHKQPSY